MFDLRREPVLIINAVGAVIEAGLVLGIAFGLDLSQAHMGAIMAFVVAVGSMITTLLARATVTPVADPRDGENRPLRPVHAEARQAVDVTVTTPVPATP